jgi:hypothetical protein
MRDVFAKTQFHQPVGQEPETPLRIAFRRLTTGEGGDVSALCAINFDRSARARLIVRDLDPGGRLAVGQRG